MKRRIEQTLLALFIVGLVCTSCGKNSDEPKPEPTPVTPVSPEETLPKYQFLRHGMSSVDLGESREIVKAMIEFDNAINAKRITNLSGAKKLFSENLLPNTCKLMAEPDLVEYRDFLNDLMNGMEQLATPGVSSRDAANGISGKIVVESDGGRYLSGSGVEYSQVLQKALMGSLLLESVNYYMKQALTASRDLVSNQNYTYQEHAWDMAYGFLGRNDLDASRYEPKFLANYIEKEAVGMKGLEGINTEVYRAFYDGRKAIVDNDMSALKTARARINTLLSRMMQLRSVYYYKEAKLTLKNGISAGNAAYFHNLGEALGFTLALPFARDINDRPYCSVAQAKALYQALTRGDGLWDKARIEGSGAGSIQGTIDEIESYRI